MVLPARSILNSNETMPVQSVSGAGETSPPITSADPGLAEPATLPLVLLPMPDDPPAPEARPLEPISRDPTSSPGPQSIETATAEASRPPMSRDEPVSSKRDDALDRVGDPEPANRVESGAARLNRAAAAPANRRTAALSKGDRFRLDRASRRERAQTRTGGSRLLRDRRSGVPDSRRSIRVAALVSPRAPFPRCRPDRLGAGIADRRGCVPPSSSRLLRVVSHQAAAFPGPGLLPTPPDRDRPPRRAHHLGRFPTHDRAVNLDRRTHIRCWLMWGKWW